MESLSSNSGNYFSNQIQGITVQIKVESKKERKKERKKKKTDRQIENLKKNRKTQGNKRNEKKREMNKSWYWGHSTFCLVGLHVTAADSEGSMIFFLGGGASRAKMRFWVKPNICRKY